MSPLACDNATCLLCGNRDLEVLIPSRALLPDEVNVLRCRHCRLVFLTSPKGQDRLGPRESTYWDNEEQNKIYFEDKIKELFFEEFEKRLTDLERLISTPNRLLDVGCGVGHFLAVARKRGWSVQGLDISPQARRAATNIYGLDVQVGTLEDRLRMNGKLKLLKDSFDVVTLWDVLEHIRRPLDGLASANRLLRMGGILAIKTPNEESLFKQLALALYRTFGDPIAFLLKYVYYVPHYFSYSKKSIEILLNRSGFDIIRFEMDETPPEFAREKIKVHYKEDPKRSIVIAMLPITNLIGRLLNRSNKLIVYAKKTKNL